MQIAPFGTWKSPISSDLVVKQNIVYHQLTLDGDDIYWLELRPLEQGRFVIVRRTPDGATRDINPAPFSACTPRP